MDQPLDRDTISPRTIRDEIAFKAPDLPKTNPGVFSCAHLTRRSHARHACDLRIGRFDGFTKAPCRVKAAMFGQIRIVDDEIPPGGRALHGACHGLGRISFADEIESFTLHGVEFPPIYFGIIAAPLRLIEESLQSAVEVFVYGNGFAAGGPFEYFGFGADEFRNKSARIGEAAGAYLPLDEISKRIWDRDIQRNWLRRPENYSTSATASAGSVQRRAACARPMLDSDGVPPRDLDRAR
jgi:hypothetical protein